MARGVVRGGGVGEGGGEVVRRGRVVLVGVWGGGGGGGGESVWGVKSVIPASAVTCPTRQCMMSICSRF